MKKTITRWLDSDVGYSFRTSPVAMGAALIALIFVVINLVVDLLYFVVDPRLRVASAGGH